MGVLCVGSSCALPPSLSPARASPVPPLRRRFAWGHGGASRGRDPDRLRHPRHPGGGGRGCVELLAGAGPRPDGHARAGGAHRGTLPGHGHRPADGGLRRRDHQCGVQGRRGRPAVHHGDPSAHVPGGQVAVGRLVRRPGCSSQPHGRASGIGGYRPGAAYAQPAVAAGGPAT